MLFLFSELIRVSFASQEFSLDNNDLISQGLRKGN